MGETIATFNDLENGPFLIGQSSKIIELAMGHGFHRRFIIKLWRIVPGIVPLKRSRKLLTNLAPINADVRSWRI